MYSIGTDKKIVRKEAEILFALKIGSGATLTCGNQVIKTSPVEQVNYVNKGEACFDTKNSRYIVRYKKYYTG